MRGGGQRSIRAVDGDIRGRCDDDDVSEALPHPVRWALVGYGSGGRVFHAPLLASQPGIDLIAVVTRDTERRAALAHRYPTVRAVEALHELVALDVAAVTIGTPPATHVPLALEAIRLGLHVVVDKPFARTAAEAAELVAAARAANRIVVPYFNRRWDGDFRTLAALVDSGRIGAVWRMESRIERSRPVKPGWASDVSAGGGVLLDLGPHLVDQALQLLGPVHRVRADLRAVRDGAVAEDSVTVDLFHDAGAHSTLTASLAAPASGPRFLVQGSRAGVRIEGFDGQETRLKAGATPSSLGNGWGAEPGRTAEITAVTGTVGGVIDGPTVHVALRRGRWDLFYRAVAAAITQGSPVPVSASDAVATARVLDAARVSSRTGRAVAIEPTAPSG